MKSGTVALIGRANAGKSTLINVLVGEKIAIVSPKPQTTRDRILGILNGEKGQVVFVDTPGLYKSKNVLSGYMTETAYSSSKDVDLLIYVIDGHREISDEDIESVKKFYKKDEPFLIVLTKSDIAEVKNLPLESARLCENGIDCDVIAVSARKGKNIKELLDMIYSLLPEGEPLYPEDVVSDKSEKFMIAEIMREKILLKYDKEIPHGVAVIVNEFQKRESGNIYDVNLDIICEKPNHKAILIGKQGKALKECSSFARQDMEKFLGSKVFLTTYVKVKEDWRDRENLVKEFGFEKFE